MLSVTYNSFMLNVIVLCVANEPFMLSVIMLNAVMLNVIVLNVIFLSVIMLNVIMPSVVAPAHLHSNLHSKRNEWRQDASR